MAAGLGAAGDLRRRERWVRQHSGAYGMGINYAKTMFGSAGKGGAAAGAVPPAARTGTAFGQSVTVDGQPRPQ